MNLAATRGQRFGSDDSPAVWLYPADKSKAATLLMIHGFRGDHHGLMAIAGSLPEFNVLIPDLPGYGKSVPLKAAHTIENYAAWLCNYSAKLTSEFGPIHLVAHSFGTQILVEALSMGLPAESVTLLNPISESAKDSRMPAKRIASLAYTFATKLGPLGSALLRNWLAVQLMSTSLALTKDKTLRRAIHAQHHRYFSNYRSDAVIVDGFRSASAHAITPTSIPAGSLLVAGEKDLVAPLEGQLKLVASRHDLRLEVLSDAGHLVHYEQPGEVARLIAENVRQHTSTKLRAARR